MKDPKQEAAKIAITELFEKNWFDICTIDKVDKLLGVIQSPRHPTWNAMHCIYYNKMSKEFREWLYSSVLEHYASCDYKMGRTRIQISLGINKPKMLKIS